MRYRLCKSRQWFEAVVGPRTDKSKTKVKATSCLKNKQLTKTTRQNLQSYWTKQGKKHQHSRIKMLVGNCYTDGGELG